MVKEFCTSVSQPFYIQWPENMNNNVDDDETSLNGCA